MGVVFNMICVAPDLLLQEVLCISYCCHVWNLPHPCQADSLCLWGMAGTMVEVVPGRLGALQCAHVLPTPCRLNSDTTSMHSKWNCCWAHCSSVYATTMTLHMDLFKVGLAAHSSGSNNSNWGWGVGVITAGCIVPKGSRTGRHLQITLYDPAIPFLEHQVLLPYWSLSQRSPFQGAGGGCWHSTILVLQAGNSMPECSIASSCTQFPGVYFEFQLLFLNFFKIKLKLNFNKTEVLVVGPDSPGQMLWLDTGCGSTAPERSWPQFARTPGPRIWRGPAR